MKLCRPTLIFFALVLALSSACERRSGTTEQSATGDILVGMYGSLTGDGASFGQSSVEGARARRRRNQQRGRLLGGRKIRLLVEDDQSKPGGGVERGHQAHHAGQGRGGARRGGEPTLAGRRAGGAEVSDSDDHARRRPTSVSREVGDYIFRVCFIDPVPGRSARQVRLQRSQGAQGRGAEGHSAGLLGGAHRLDQKTFTAPRRTGARPGELQLGRRRLQGHPDAGAQPEARRDLRDRLLPRGGHHRAAGPRARHEDADSGR